ncbi:MAG: hypothetical protein J0I98_06925 [Mesorhizobium sp.]|nr:hypothetical protein [Mesorhizobium sp.]MBN9242508.1 hypothetical protein [Mesorhizobium sp.]
MKIKPIHFERSWPYVGAVAFVCGWLYLTGGSKFPSDPLPMLAAAGTVASVLVGFIITAETIVLSLTGSAVFRKLVATGYAAMLFNYLHEALWGALGFLVISFVGFFSLADGIAPKWFAILFVAFAACSILLFVRIATILSKLLKNAS